MFLGTPTYLNPVGRRGGPLRRHRHSILVEHLHVPLAAAGGRQTIGPLRQLRHLFGGGPTLPAGFGGGDGLGRGFPCGGARGARRVTSPEPHDAVVATRGEVALFGQGATAPHPVGMLHHLAATTAA